MTVAVRTAAEDGGVKSVLALMAGLVVVQVGLPINSGGVVILGKHLLVFVVLGNGLAASAEDLLSFLRLFAWL